MDVNDVEYYRPEYGWGIRHESRWGRAPGAVDLVHVQPSGCHSTTMDTDSLVALHKVLSRELQRRAVIEPSA